MKKEPQNTAALKNSQLPKMAHPREAIIWELLPMFLGEGEQFNFLKRPSEFGNHSYDVCIQVAFICWRIITYYWKSKYK